MILASQISNARSRNNERQLERALSKFFYQLHIQLQANLKKYWSDILLNGQVDLIIKPVMESQAEYYHILQKYDKREYKLGQEEARRLVKLSKHNHVFKAKKPKLKLEDQFIKDFYQLVLSMEGTSGIELKPVYNRLKRKYKPQVKNRAEFEALFSSALQSTNTRLYPARDPDLKVIFGKGKDKRGFGYIDRSKLKAPVKKIPVEPPKEEPKPIEAEPPKEEPKTIEPTTNDNGLIITDTYDLFATLQGAEQDLMERVFVASQGTLARVEQDIMNTLLDGYKSGKGINYVANQITKRFGQLQSWEAKRIARTEIHNSHNTAVMDTYNELGVEYTMWVSAHDNRVRTYEKGDQADHKILDGEIIRLGDTYSNGLRYPGDTDGPLVEWINCRCANAPFNMPYGYTAPPQEQFHESDLIKIK